MMIQKAAPPPPPPPPKPAAKPADTSNTRKLPIGLIIGLNVVVILAIALILYFVLRPAPPQPETATPAPVTESGAPAASGDAPATPP